MKIILIGTGGPKPDPHRQGPCLVIQADDRYLIFDAGRGATTGMAATGIPIDRLGPVFITHHHYDHIGNLGDLILSGWNLGRKQPLDIFGPKGTFEMVDVLLNRLYQKDIDFRMSEAALSGVALTDIRQMVRARDVTPGLVYEDRTVRVFCDDVLHGHGLGISADSWKCLGYRVESAGKAVTVSGDTVECDGLYRLARNTGVLVLCCYLSHEEMTGSEARLIADHILVCAPEAGKIAQKAGAGKLVLTHIREKSQAEMDAMVKAIKKDFPGPVIAGQDLMVIDV